MWWRKAKRFWPGSTTEPGEKPVMQDWASSLLIGEAQEYDAVNRPGFDGDPVIV